jgi:O-antigen/teichoic acid export membrane protein
MNGEAPESGSLAARIVSNVRSKARGAREGQVVRNAATLYGTTIVTSLLGFFYWFVAARMASPSAVGTASAVQSAAMFLSIFCVLGLSTLIIGEIANDRSVARMLLLTSATLVGVFAVIVAVGTAFLFRAFSHALRPGLVGPGQFGLFVALAALTTILLILDDACIGLMRGDLQLRRNTVFSVVKLALVPLLVAFWPSPAGSELVAAWLFGLLASLVTVGLALQRVTEGQTTRIDFGLIIRHRSMMIGHHWLNLSVQSPRLIIPVLVATIVGPSANAAFTAAMLFAGFVTIIPYHLSTVLFALAPGDEVNLQKEISRTMRICLVLSLVSVPFFFILARPVLAVFGPHYVVATDALVVLGFTTYPLAIKTHYVAVARVRGNMRQAARRTMLGAVLEVGLAAAGAVWHGITGVAIGFLAALLIEAILFSPTVFGAMNRPYRHRRS